jgi:hypothetical protein
MNYQYVGPGKGIPGLPHFITAEEAEKMEAEYKKVEALKKKKASKLSAREKRLLGHLEQLPFVHFERALEMKLYKKTSRKEPPEKDPPADDAPVDQPDEVEKIGIEPVIGKDE